MSWSESSIPSLAGKTIVVTGANTGIGFEAAKIFSACDAQVVLACRNISKMEAAASRIEKEYPNASLIQLQVDVSDLDSVRAFAKSLRTAVSKIDILLLNAGATFLTYEKSPQGFEKMFATNHLGHFLMTGLLIDMLKPVPNSRVVAVSSLAHSFTHSIDYTAARGEAPQKFDFLRVYSESKLANQWFVRELQKKLKEASAETIAVPCHPGASATELARDLGNNWMAHLMMMVFKPFQQSARRGSLPLVMACLADEVEEGSYCGPSRWGGLNGPPIADGWLSKTVADGEKSAELWSISEELTGFQYQI